MNFSAPGGTEVWANAPGIFWILLITAPFIGSFLGVLVRRLPMAAPVVRSRSACPACGTVLGPADLVPLISYGLSRGRCRHCQGRIDPFHPLIELAAMAVVLLASLTGRTDTLLADCVLGWTLLALAWIDLETMLLPDALTLPLLLAGFGEAWWSDPAQVPDRVLAALLGWASFSGLSWLWHRLRGIDALGGGDARLLAAGGAWLGWQSLPLVVLMAALLAITVTIARFGRDLDPRRRIAFGPWLAISIWLVRLWDGWLT